MFWLNFFPAPGLVEMQFFGFLERLGDKVLYRSPLPCPTNFTPLAQIELQFSSHFRVIQQNKTFEFLKKDVSGPEISVDKLPKILWEEFKKN